MKGFIIRYNSDLTPREIIDINNLLFGRVVRIKRKNKDYFYYYRGIFHDIPYFKLANGCYFTKTITSIHIDNIEIMTANIDIKDNMLQNSAEHFNNKYNDKEVINLE